MKVVIIGSGSAGYAAAETIRKSDGNCEITLFTDDSYPPYYRPRLIEVLAAKAAIKDILIKKEEWYLQNRITLNTGRRVESVNTAEKNVKTADGGLITYDKLMIATGSNAFIPPVKGIEAGAYTVKNAGDVALIIECSKKYKKAVVMGGGLLGIETARALCERGVSTVVVEHNASLMPRQLDPEAGEFLLSILSKQGLEFRLGAEVTGISGEAGEMSVALKQGEIIQTGFVIISAGVRPDVKIALAAGINVNKGIVVDDRLQTSVPGVYAAGDVCEHKGRLYGIWPAAREQAIVAAKNMIGIESVYAGSMFSTRLKVSGINLVSIGNISTADCRQYGFVDEKAGIYKKIFAKDGEVQGAVLLGDIKDEAVIRDMLKEGVAVSEERLRELKLEEKT